MYCHNDCACGSEVQRQTIGNHHGAPNHRLWRVAETPKFIKLSSYAKSRGLARIRRKWNESLQCHVPHPHLNIVCQMMTRASKGACFLPPSRLTESGIVGPTCYWQNLSRSSTLRHLSSRRTSRRLNPPRPTDEPWCRLITWGGRWQYFYSSELLLSQRQR